MPKATIVVEANRQEILDALLSFFDSTNCSDAASSWLEFVEVFDDEDAEDAWEWNLVPDAKEATTGFRFEGPAADELFGGKFVDRALDAASECFHNAMEPVCDEFSYVEDHDVEGEPFVEGHWLWTDGETRVFLV